MHVNCKVNPGLEKSFNCYYNFGKIFVSFGLLLFCLLFALSLCCTVHVLYWIFFTLPLSYPPTKRLPLESTHKPDIPIVYK